MGSLCRRERGAVAGRPEAGEAAEGARGEMEITEGAGKGRGCWTLQVQRRIIAKRTRDARCSWDTNSSRVP